MSGTHGGRKRTFHAQSTGSGDVNGKKSQTHQQRQLLSCTKCRERKVKCDRTKPCSACCARGAPKDCQFIAEGGDYAPIQQSYELKKLRAENVKLKERLRACRASIEGEDSDLTASPDSQGFDRPTSSQKRGAKQKRFQGHDWQDSIYFGSPGLATVIHDFAFLNLDPSVNLSHIAPRGANMYTPKSPPPHAFATLFKATPEECIPQLLSCLPSKPELLEYLEIFENRVSSFTFPHTLVEIAKDEVEFFLSDSRNAHLCPDMLALLFAAISLGAQYSTWNKAGGKWDAQVIDRERRKGDVYIAAAMQALRLSSFMHKPSLRSIQTLIMIGPYLTNSGRFLDAWTLFGTTIRSAHAIGLHRHTKFLDPAPSTQKECSIRQTLWWWMLHMDEQYSMTLGRPLGISGIGDCPWPHELTTDPTMLRFGEFVNHHTILARSILSSERLTNAKIDDFTDALRALLDTMPEILQFQPSWTRDETEAPDLALRMMATVYFCRTHTYLVLLNRQRMDKPMTNPLDPGGPASTMPFRAVNEAAASHRSPTAATNVPLRGRAAVLASSEALITAFLFFYQKDPASLIDWSLGQQAFNSAMLLLFDAIELRRVNPAIAQVERAYVIFKDLEDNGVHKLAGLAVEKISWGLAELHKVLQTLNPDGAEHGHQAEGTGAPGSRNEVDPRREGLNRVMGNTGMMLLEDPGLQAFHPEPFSPIKWDAPGLGTEPLRDEVIQQSMHPAFGGNFQHPRYTYSLQGEGNSPTVRSAPSRYATPAEEDVRPCGKTAPTSPTGFATMSRAGVGTAECRQNDLQSCSDRHSMGPPHLPQAQSSVPTGLPRSRMEVHGAHGDPPEWTAHVSSHQSMLGFPQQSSYEQSRHHSCPSFARQGQDHLGLLPSTLPSPSGMATRSSAVPCAPPPHPPFMRAQPGTQPSPAAAIHDAPVYRYHLHTAPQHRNHHDVHFSSMEFSSAARTATPVTSMAEVAMGFPSLSARSYESSDQLGDAMQQDRPLLLQEQVPSHSVPMQYTNTVASAISHSAQGMSPADWRRCAGSYEAG